MKNLTKIALEQGNENYSSKTLRISAIIASVFSVIFSLSIVGQLTEIVSTVAVIVLGLFVALFLVWNEHAKVDEIRKWYGGQSYSKVLLGFTLVLSLTLSSCGIYFWVNKTIKNGNAIVAKETNHKLLIKKRYATQIDSIRNQEFLVNETLIKDRDYWRNKSSRGNDSIRLVILANIDAFDNQIKAAEETFNTNKVNTLQDLERLREDELASVGSIFQQDKDMVTLNNYISYLFLLLTLITEFIIVVINKKIAVTEIKMNELLSNSIVGSFRRQYKILQSLYLSNSKNDKFTIKDLNFSLANKIDEKNFHLSRSKVRTMFDNLDAWGIADFDGASITNGGVPTSKLLMDQNEGLKTFENKFSTLLDIHS